MMLRFRVTASDSAGQSPADHHASGMTALSAGRSDWQPRPGRLRLPVNFKFLQASLCSADSGLRLSLSKARGLFTPSPSWTYSSGRKLTHAVHDDDDDDDDDDDGIQRIKPCPKAGKFQTCQPD